MENKNFAVIIGLLSIIVGLLIGYFFGMSGDRGRYGFFSTETMYEEMEEHMYGDELIDGDGAMQHMMDEMMFIGKGATGAAYEEAFLRGMIVHHLGAIAMAERLLEETNRPELIELANNIITSQSKEVDQMKAWLTAWFK